MHGIAAYNRTTTNSPNEQILLLLLEQAIKNQNRAISAMEEGNRTAWATEIHNCRAIFLELVGSLDTSMVPEIARNLQQTYGWCLHHLQEASKTGNAETVRSVLRVTDLLHSTWAEAVQKWDEEHGTSPFEEGER